MRRSRASCGGPCRESNWAACDGGGYPFQNKSGRGIVCQSHCGQVDVLDAGEGGELAQYLAFSAYDGQDHGLDPVFIDELGSEDGFAAHRIALAGFGAVDRHEFVALQHGVVVEQLDAQLARTPEHHMIVVREIAVWQCGGQVQLLERIDIISLPAFRAGQALDVQCIRRHGEGVRAAVAGDAGGAATVRLDVAHLVLARLIFGAHVAFVKVGRKIPVFTVRQARY